MENETLSKKEFAYIRQQEKSEAVIVAQDAKIENLALQNAELIKKAEMLTVENEKLSNSELAKKVETLTSENEQLKADLEETTRECQTHIDNVEAQHDELEKKIGEHKPKITSNGENKEEKVKEEETKKEDKIIYRKRRSVNAMLFPSNPDHWLEEEISPTDTEKIKSLIKDGYKKK